MMYLNFYHLREIPFASPPEVKFFYRSKEHMRALRRVLSAVVQGEMACLIGEIGSGKTILIEALLQNLGEDFVPVVIRDPRFRAQEFLEFINQKLGVKEISSTRPKLSSSELKEKILARLEERAQNHQKVVIILDEAQLLSDPQTLEELRLLTNLERGRNLSLLLVGQPELGQRLQEPFYAPLRQRIRVFYTLGRLSSSETAAYVKHRLQVAGCSQCPFSSSALRTIFRFSRGIPRLINHLATSALEEGYLHQKLHINKSLVKQVGINLTGKRVRWRIRGVVATISLLMVLGGFWLLKAKKIGFPFPAKDSVVSTSPSPTSVPHSSIPGEIVFASDRNGNWEIYLMDMKNLSIRQLTFSRAWNGDPSFSPDRKKILFASNRDGNHDIYLMNLDGSSLSNLTSSSYWEGEPVWNPNGKEIAFTSNRDGNYQIYILNLESGVVHQLIHSPGENWSPTWSLDGKYLAYSSNRYGNYQIFQWNFSEEKERRFTDTKGNCWSPSWSPSGDKLVFVSDQDGNPEIYSLSLTGGEIFRLTDNPQSDLNPYWGQDGTLLFASNRTGNYEVYLLSGEDFEAQRITNSGEGNSWSPRW